MRLLEPSSIDEATKKRPQRGSPLRQRSRHRVKVAAIDVAPSPRFITFEGCDHRMTGRIEMRECMSMLRILATSDMTAGKTYAKFIPRRTERKALLATVRARFHFPYRIEMLATIVHGRKSSIGRTIARSAALSTSISMWHTADWDTHRHNLPTKARLRRHKLAPARDATGRRARGRAQITPGARRTRRDRWTTPSECKLRFRGLTIQADRRPAAGAKPRRLDRPVERRVRPQFRCCPNA